MKTVALIPCYNEERAIAKIIIGCERYCNKILVCDDGSTDQTGRIAKRLGAEVITLQKNQGKGAALQALFKRTIEMNADIAVTIDGDGQHSPEEIPILLKQLKDFDIVIGARKNVPTIRAAGNAVLRGFQQFDTESGFRAYKGQVLSGLIPSENGMAADREIFDKAKQNGLAIGQVEVNADYSVPNPSKKNMFLHFADVFLNTMKHTTIRFPVIFGIIGLILIGLGAYFAQTSLPYLQTEGFGTVILFMAGLFFISTSLLIWYMTNILKRAQR